MRILAKNKDENKKQHIFTIELDTSEENKDLIDEVVYALLFAQESKLENFYWEYENRIDYALDRLVQLSKELSDVSYDIRREMYKSNFLDILGRHHMYRQFESALHKAEHDLALKEAREV